MTQDQAALYSAYAARDARFDGVFFIGVTSTGIYCRPVCTARTPRAANCRFFGSAAAAEQARFRPCLRCRPELAPGTAPVDDPHRIAALIARRIDEGLLHDAPGIEHVAATFGWSTRQIRRMLRRSLGVSPMALVTTRRLLLAKQLLTETQLPIGEVAHASGYRSLRRFNAAFTERYAMPPSRFRRATGVRQVPAAEAHLTLRLAYRPPYDWDAMLRFLETRALAGVERIENGQYARTVRLGGHEGWVRVRHDASRRSLVAELSHSLTPALPAVLGRLRHLFDLDARPDVIGATLSTDAALRRLVARRPGLRVPGAFDGFELAVRAILGQQVSVKGATTLAGRLVTAFGVPVSSPVESLTHHPPTAGDLAATSAGEIAALGIVPARAESIVSLARAVMSGAVSLEPGAEVNGAVMQLTAIRGIGAWTAQYIAMRALHWPDAFPASDLILRRRLGDVTAGAAESRSQAWRPWRSYAVMHLWSASG